jgi:FtsZ-interacting cell division protein ZipA
MFKLPELGTKLLAIIALVVVLLVVIGLLFSQWQKRQAAETQGRLDRGQAEAAAASGQEAMNTVAAVEANAAETRDTVKEATREIEQAPDGNSNDAAERATCRLRLYYNSQRCAALREADTAKPAR